MKTLLTIAHLAIAITLPAADTITARRGVPERGAIAPPPPVAPVILTVAQDDGKLYSRLYADSFLSLRTTDFSHDETFGYGAAVGYQFTPVFAADLRVEHEGLNITGQAIRTVGGRVSARLPIQFLAPSVFCGAAFDLGPDEWRLQPGISAEIGMSKVLRGMSLIVEGGLDANLRGQSGFLFTSGLRWRF